MNRFINDLERKFGKYAIPNLTLYIIGLYVIGYFLQLTTQGALTSFLTLNPAFILKWQVWRLFSWLLIPPDSFSILIIITLVFYYFVGTTMERTMGTFRYNLFIFSGFVLMILASFVAYGLYVVTGSSDAAMYMYYYSPVFSTFYIQQMIFLAFAIVYPDMQVLLMFIIPVKIKYLGILYAAILGYSFILALINAEFCTIAAIAFQAFNLLLFYISIGKAFHFKPSEVKRRKEYNRNVKIMPMGVSRHKCAVCGRTEADNPDLEFRFCSKCNGNYEYCKDHIYTHQHIK
jgi:hypothetical protein